MRIFSITAVCNHDGSALNGERTVMWTGASKKQANLQFVKLQNKYLKYANWQVEVKEINVADIKI